MRSELINGLMTDILCLLAKYQYLSVSQLQFLTGGKSVSYLRECLGRLLRFDGGYIKSFRVEVSYKVRAENIYMLKENGRSFLQAHKNAISIINMPVGTTPVVRDYFHRVNSVWLHILLDNYCSAHGITITNYDAYYHKTGSTKKGNLTAKSQISLTGNSSYYIPDAVLQTTNGLYLLEMYCDKDSKRILNQLGTHAKAIALGTPSKKYGIAANPFVLSVFEHEGIKNAVIQKMKANTNIHPATARLFFFASLADIKTDINTAWKDINGNTISIT